MSWTVKTPKKETNFLNLSIIINKNNHITHKTYKKPLNLHNYLPVNSAHQPGTFKSLVVGFIRRYWLMNSNIKDFTKQISKFAEGLSKRGHSKEKITLAFSEASTNIQKQMKFRKVFFRAKPKNNTNKIKHSSSIVHFTPDAHLAK